MKRTLLIDGDIIAYQSAVKSEQPIKWDDNLWTLHSYTPEAIKMVDDGIDALKKKLKADSIVVAITDTKNFRKDVLPTYKDNRKQKRKPLVLGDMRSHLIKKYKAVFYTSLEADDVLGILATKPSKDETIICSIDKDFMGVPCNYCRDGETVQKISLNEANHFHMIQTLTGDTVDGYSGVPKVGAVTANKMLADKDMPVKDMWEIVVKAYEKAGMNEQDALQQARVARILRHGEYDKKTGEVKLWQI